MLRLTSATRGELWLAHCGCCCVCSLRGLGSRARSEPSRRGRPQRAKTNQLARAPTKSARSAASELAARLLLLKLSRRLHNDDDDDDDDGGTSIGEHNESRGCELLAPTKRSRLCLSHHSQALLVGDAGLPGRLNASNKQAEQTRTMMIIKRNSNKNSAPLVGMQTNNWTGNRNQSSRGRLPASVSMLLFFSRRGSSFFVRLGLTRLAGRRGPTMSSSGVPGWRPAQRAAQYCRCVHLFWFLIPFFALRGGGGHDEPRRNPKMEVWGAPERSRRAVGLAAIRGHQLRRLTHQSSETIAPRPHKR